MKKLPHYYLAKPDDWYCRKGAKPNQYHAQVLTAIDLNDRLPIQTPGFAFLGFACDEGVKRNDGREGARQGPKAFMEQFTGLPVRQADHLYDAGTVVCDDDLSLVQEALGTGVERLLKAGLTPLVIGGGHETAWGHYQGIEKFLGNQSLAIINFDAHFDLRPIPKDNVGTSGTPFRQIAMKCKKGKKAFDYYCFGIQQNANTKSLFSTAKKLNVEYVLAETMHQRGAEYFIPLIEKIADEHDAIYLSICMDVFSASIAPGVSAVQPFGLMPMQVLPLLKAIASTKKVVSMDIVELAPKYDIHSQTSKLAAYLAAELINFLSFN